MGPNDHTESTLTELADVNSPCFYIYYAILYERIISFIVPKPKDMKILVQNSNVFDKVLSIIFLTFFKQYSLQSIFSLIRKILIIFEKKFLNHIF